MRLSRIAMISRPAERHGTPQSVVQNRRRSKRSSGVFGFSKEGLDAFEKTAEGLRRTTVTSLVASMRSGGLWNRKGSWFHRSGPPSCMAWRFKVAESPSSTPWHSSFISASSILYQAQRLPTISPHRIIRSTIRDAC